MQPANDNIIVRPAGHRPDRQFEAMIAQLRPGNVDPFDGHVGLGSVALTNPMAERLGQALLATNRTVTRTTIRLDSMTPEGSAYPSLLRFLESSALGAIMLVGNPDGAATPAADERMNQTVTTILSSMHRNAESFVLHLGCMALLPTVLSLALEFVRNLGIHLCTLINNKRETTETRPLVPVASALAPCRVFLYWDEDTLPNEAYEMLAALANIMARPLESLLCDCGGLGLSVQLAQSILDLAKRQARRQESPIDLYLHFETIAWQAGSIEILTQDSSAIDLFAIQFTRPETDQGIVQRAQIDLLECLQSSTVKTILVRTSEDDPFLDANGQEKLNRIVQRNRIVPHLLSGQCQPDDRSFCYLLPYALMVGAEHGHFFVLVAKWIAANDHRTRMPALSPPTSPSSEHAGSSQDDDNNNDFGTDARVTK
jgi:uncharacterized protein YggT (Ycf19 family)